MDINGYRINLDGFVEQDIPMQCPECEAKMTALNIFGWGLYPRGGHRASMKPNSIYGVGMDCPNCFAKSCFHDSIQGVESWIECMVDTVKRIGEMQ